MRGDPEFQSLMARAEADVAAQRERIERNGRDETFENALSAALARMAAAP